MDANTQVPGQPGGVAPQNGTMTPGGSRDVGAADLDARLNSRIEQVASGFRSVLDKRVGGLERTNQQLAQELQIARQQLGQIQGYFTQAQEAEMDPDERQKRQDARMQMATVQREQELIKNARQQNAAFKVAVALQDFGYRWNDPKLDWAPDLYEKDPDGWASTVMLNASRTYAREVAESTQRRQTGAVDTQRTHAQEVQNAQRVEHQNAQRAAQAATVSIAQPQGDGTNWLDRVKQMDRKEKLEFIQRTQRGILHGEITHPSQSR